MTDAAPRTQGGAGVDGPLETMSGPRRPRPSSLRADVPGRLTRLLLLKSLAEFALVAVLAAGLLFMDLRAGLTGAIEVIDGRTLKGWVEGAGDERGVEVQLFIDGRFASSVVAERRREATGGAVSDGRRDFAFRLDADAGAEHEARAYAVTGGREGVRRTLTLLGEPVRFRLARAEGE